MTKKEEKNLDLISSLKLKKSKKEEKEVYNNNIN